jgi:hypothetical protein
MEAVMNLKKKDGRRACTGFSWLRIESSNGCPKE